MSETRDTFEPIDFLSRAGNGRTIEKYRTRETVYRQGDLGSAVYYLQKGKAKKSVTSRNGKEAVVAILEPGDFFGEGCLSGMPRRLLTITAMTDCAVMRLEKSAMMTALNDEPKLSALFIAHLLRRSSRFEQGMADQLINPSEKRLARMLLMLANVDKAGTQPPAIARISQETLAEMVGTTRSRISFFMNKFRRARTSKSIRGSKPYWNKTTPAAKRSSSAVARPSGDHHACL